MIDAHLIRLSLHCWRDGGKASAAQLRSNLRQWRDYGRPVAMRRTRYCCHRDPMGRFEVWRDHGRTVVLFFGRWRELFDPLVWLGPDGQWLMFSEALRLVSGAYAELRTAQARRMVEPVPAAAQGLPYC